MHFIDTWTELPLLDLLRLLAPAVFLGIALFLPGRWPPRIAAFLTGAAIVLLPELGSPLQRAGWVALWFLVTWQAGAAASGDVAPPPRSSGAESGFVGLLLGLSLLALLVAGIARQDLAPEDGRRASWGLVVLGLGLLHLMLRRHALRSLVGFAAIGLGLQMLHGAARASQLAELLPAEGAVLLATALAVALVARVGRIRQRTSGSAWIADAHDLHD